MLAGSANIHRFSFGESLADKVRRKVSSHEIFISNVPSHASRLALDIVKSICLFLETDDGFAWEKRLSKSRRRTTIAWHYVESTAVDSETRNV